MSSYISIETQFSNLFSSAKIKSDILTNYFLCCYFLFGLYLATYFDTWDIAITVGGACLIAYYATKTLIPDSVLYQYVLSAIAGVFMAQFIYQMHGMFEMHFFAFIGSAILISYHNWKLQLPLAIVVLVHHGTFAYLQYVGFGEVYFTQLDFMSIKTFIIHVLLSAIIFFLSGLWAFNFRKQGNEAMAQTFEIGKLQESKLQKDTLEALSNHLYIVNEELKEAQLLAQIGNWNFDPLSKKLEWSDNLRNIYGAHSIKEPDIPTFLSIVHTSDRAIILDMMLNAQCGTSSDLDFKIIKPNGEVRILNGKTNCEVNAKGETVRIYGIVQDISERKNAEKAQELNKDMTDGINYAQRLQRALFTSTDELKRHFPKSFIFNKPQQIVGGDFYWFHATDKNKIIACVDCTGHGVPGAFMSVVGIGLLNKIVKDQKYFRPSEILRQLDDEINLSIGVDKEDGVMDGMDLSLCNINTDTKKINFAGAMNPIVIVSDGIATLIKGTRHAIGGYRIPATKKFETHTIDYKIGDMMYMFSDGLTDQLGGPENKRFRLPQLLELLVQIHMLDSRQQKEKLASKLADWKGSAEQTDDVMVVGLELT